MARVDAHCHFWHLERGDYDWLDASDPALAAIARDFSPGDIQSHLRDAGVEQVVVIQAAASAAETDYLLTLADQHDTIAGVVGWVDLSSSQATHWLQTWAAHPKFKGIRPMLQDIEQTDWLLSVPPKSIWQSLTSLGIRFDALIQPRHLPVLNEFCRDNPELPVVIDHAAKPKQALAGDEAAFDEWKSGMAQLATHDSVYCKLSGLLTELAAGSISSARTTLAPVVDTLLELFGADRLLWGSDWPVLTLAADYPAWDALTAELLNALDLDSKAAILGGTATRFYGLGDNA